VILGFTGVKDIRFCRGDRGGRPYRQFTFIIQNIKTKINGNARTAKYADRGGGSQLLRYCGAAESRTQRNEYRCVLLPLPLSMSSLS